MHQYLIICVWRICIESISLLYIELAICSIIILFPQKEVSLHQSTFFKEKKKKLFIFNSVAFCIKVVWFLISKNMLKPKTLKNVKYLWNSIPSAYFLKLFLIPAIFLTYSLTTWTLNAKSFFCLHTCVIWCIAHWRRCLEAHKWPSTGTYTKKSNNGPPLHTGFFALWNTVSLRWIADILKSYYTVEIEEGNSFKMFSFHPGHPVERNDLKILRFFCALLMHSAHYSFISC